jgi:hypothetical protein
MINNISIHVASASELRDPRPRRRVRDKGAGEVVREINDTIALYIAVNIHKVAVVAIIIPS